MAVKTRAPKARSARVQKTLPKKKALKTRKRRRKKTVNGKAARIKRSYK
tara:strand:+ start:2171 stop:2317 length:147 start_codon:yes stop_codon:yes gene_type:complete